MSYQQPSRDVFWRRRLLVLAVLIALVWGAIQLVGLIRGSDSDQEPAAQQGPTTAPSEPVEPEPSPEPEPEPEPAIAAGEPVPIGLSTRQDDCAAENIRTIAMVPEGQKAGGPIQIELLLSTIDSTPCTFTPSARDLLIVIEANDKPVYDSTVCREPFLKSPVVIAQGFGTLVRTTWTGRGSGRDCNPKEGFVKGGKFVLKAGAYGGEPSQRNFTLASAPKPTPTPTPKASASPSPSASPDASESPETND